MGSRYRFDEFSDLVVRFYQTKLQNTVRLDLCYDFKMPDGDAFGGPKSERFAMAWICKPEKSDEALRLVWDMLDLKDGRSKPLGAGWRQMAKPRDRETLKAIFVDDPVVADKASLVLHGQGGMQRFRDSVQFELRRMGALVMDPIGAGS